MNDDPTSDRVWARAEIESPCIKLCIIHPETRLCTGCHRTLDEIAEWSRMTPEARRLIMSELPTRGVNRKRRGGRNRRRG